MSGVQTGTIETNIPARLDRLPPFGRRVLQVPFRLNHPVWVADRPIDVPMTAPAPMRSFRIRKR